MPTPCPRRPSRSEATLTLRSARDEARPAGDGGRLATGRDDWTTERLRHARSRWTTRLELDSNSAGSTRFVDSCNGTGLGAELPNC